MGCHAAHGIIFLVDAGTFGDPMTANWQVQTGEHVGNSIRPWQTMNRPFSTRLGRLLVTEVMKMQNRGHPPRLSCISSLLLAVVAPLTPTTVNRSAHHVSPPPGG